MLTTKEKSKIEEKRQRSRKKARKYVLDHANNQEKKVLSFFLQSYFFPWSLALDESVLFFLLYIPTSVLIKRKKYQLHLAKRFLIDIFDLWTYFFVRKKNIYDYGLIIKILRVKGTTSWKLTPPPFLLHICRKLCVFFAKCRSKSFGQIYNKKGGKISRSSTFKVI